MPVDNGLYEKNKTIHDIELGSAADAENISIEDQDPLVSLERNIMIMERSMSASHLEKGMYGRISKTVRFPSIILT